MSSVNNMTELSSDEREKSVSKLEIFSPTSDGVPIRREDGKYADFMADIRKVLYSTSAPGVHRNIPHSSEAETPLDDYESSDTTSYDSSRSGDSTFSDHSSKERSASNLTSTPESSATSRIFWSAGTDEVQPTRNFNIQDATVMDHARISPKYLHTNATSHKWAFGAIAELLDNAVDEIRNGATYVKVNKILNPRDNSTALLIQDDGGGMNPNALRGCMSFGFSRKDHPKLIGKYGNGFKTSTMRLGADVIVFTRHHDRENRTRTQSVGVLSYTFLRKEGFDDVVVPMIDYKITKDKVPKELLRNTEENWRKNLRCILAWSPFMSETELLSQFLDMDSHGTKIIIYNLWLNSDGDPELEFETDKHDIQLRGNTRLDQAIRGEPAESHIANRYQSSLRVYASILYLRKPKKFEIILRDKVVNHYSIVSSLIHMEEDTYKPKLADKEGVTHEVKTKIGFIQETRIINVHGFNLYHKNRLIMPFMKVFMENSSRGRGVVAEVTTQDKDVSNGRRENFLMLLPSTPGVLEANFIAPAHDKQEFERTSIFSRLTTRLRNLQLQYWTKNGYKVGYQIKPSEGKKRGPMATSKSIRATKKRGRTLPNVLDEDSESLEGTQGLAGSEGQPPSNLPGNPNLPKQSNPSSSRKTMTRCRGPKYLPVDEMADIQNFVQEISTAATVENTSANKMVTVETSPGSLTIPISKMFGIKSRVEELQATVEDGFSLMKTKDEQIKILQEKVLHLERELLRIRDRRRQLVAHVNQITEETQPNGLSKGANGQLEAADTGNQMNQQLLQLEVELPAENSQLVADDQPPSTFGAQPSASLRRANGQLQGEAGNAGKQKWLHPRVKVEPHDI